MGISPQVRALITVGIRGALYPFRILELPFSVEKKPTLCTFQKRTPESQHKDASKPTKKPSAINTETKHIPVSLSTV